MSGATTFPAAVRDLALVAAYAVSKRDPRIAAACEWMDRARDHEACALRQPPGSAQREIARDRANHAAAIANVYTLLSEGEPAEARRWVQRARLWRQRLRDAGAWE
jgi:hypothetical protein